MLDYFTKVIVIIGRSIGPLLLLMACKIEPFICWNLYFVNVFWVSHLCSVLLQ